MFEFGVLTIIRSRNHFPAASNQWSSWAAAGWCNVAEVSDIPAPAALSALKCHEEVTSILSCHGSLF